MRELRFQYRLAIWLPWLLYVAHALFYLDWLVDDAGISFAYARHAAEGYGLVSQPGREPVEAYSNPLWVFIMCGWMWLGWFHLYITPKVVAALCVLGTYAAIGISLRNHSGLKPPLIGLVLTLMSLNGPWVAWLNCGLENPLYALLIASQVWVSLRLLRTVLTRTLLLSGVIAGSLIMVRPDGMLFSLLVPLGLVFGRHYSFNQKVDHVAVWGIGWLLTAGVYLGIRHGYFETAAPTSFLAKPSLDPAWLIDPLKWHNLFRAVAGPMGAVLVMLLMGAIGWLLWRRRLMRQTVVWLVHLGGSILVFLLLPYDHLGWYRYATPFVLLIYPATTLIIHGLYPYLSGWWKQTSIRATLIAMLLLGTASLGVWVTYQRVSHPPVSLEEVRDRYVRPFQALADGSHLRSYSVFVPDAGAPLWYGDGDVFDCLGLLDVPLAMSFDQDTLAYQNRILDDIQPTFIALHGPWIEEVALLEHPTFQRDYQLLATQFDPDSLPGPQPMLFARKATVKRHALLAAWQRYCQEIAFRCQP